MWEKIETFLFDLIGLLLPGIIFLVGITFTSFFLLPETFLDSFTEIPNKIPFVALIISTLEEVKGQILFLTLLFLLHAYLVGHVIKVFSKIFYSFFVIIFDETFNKLFKFTKNKLLNSSKIYIKIFFSIYKRIKTYKIFKYPIEFVELLFKFLSHIAKEIFVFKPNDYEPPNKKFLDESMVYINQKFNTDFPKEWYSFYKLAKIIISHENLQSMNETFLAKYNLYRSLSFITFLQISVILFLNISSIELNSYSGEISLTLLILNFFFWYTFHEKYKRYFRLCGNEILVAIYYHFKKPSLSQGEQN